MVDGCPFYENGFIIRTGFGKAAFPWGAAFI
jgi:hypothetical protein